MNKANWIIVIFENFYKKIYWRELSFYSVGEYFVTLLHIFLS